jgi:NADH:ubiquinone oxidoreductase subunit K
LWPEKSWIQTDKQLRLACMFVCLLCKLSLKWTSTVIFLSASVYISIKCVILHFTSFLNTLKKKVAKVFYLFLFLILMSEHCCAIVILKLSISYFLNSIFFIWTRLDFHATYVRQRSFSTSSYRLWNYNLNIFFDYHFNIVLVSWLLWVFDPANLYWFQKISFQVLAAQLKFDQFVFVYFTWSLQW